MCDPNVKPENRTLFQRICVFVDRHPRTGWYLFAVVLFNFIVNLLQIFG